MRARKPFTLANWKMAMTAEESLAFVGQFLASAADLATRVDIVICPPYTTLSQLTRAVAGTPLAVGGQDLWSGSGNAHTGAISGALLADAGATWVMVGHWEVRRRMRETDVAVNLKVRAALETGLRPILLVGEEWGTVFDAGRLSALLNRCPGETVAQMAFVYEPEGAIGMSKPATPGHAARGCRAIRAWLAQEYGTDVAGQTRVIYGGSVTPAHAPALLADPDLDGLGASREGRDPAAFAEIVRRIAASHDL